MNKYVYAVMFVLLLTGFGDSKPTLKNPGKILNICYISLNNKKEFELTKSFIDKIETRLGIEKQFNVIEFQEQGSSPEETFKKMANSRQACDGLIISGHHTGAFGGTRASGTLKIDTLEKLSCEVQHEKWFGEINSLWLQGCRTLGAEKETTQAVENLAEYHAQRVALVRAQDGLNQTQSQLEDEFATILDSETPYASRFFKTFYNSKVFGWTMTAPGEKYQSEFSFLFHIANVGRRNLASENMSIEALENPTKQELGEYSAATYYNALVTLLTKNSGKTEIVNSIEGWIDHGKRADSSQKIFGFDNPELKAYPPLMVEGDRLTLNARHLDCQLRRATKPSEIESAIGDILSSQESIGFSFYTLKDVIQEKLRNPISRRAIKKSVGRNKNLMEFLTRKISHKHIGIAKKLDYAGLYLLITDDRENPLVAKILQIAATRLQAKLVIDSSYSDRRSEKISIVKSLVLSNLISTSTLLNWIGSSQDNTLADAVADSLRSFSGEKIKVDLLKVVNYLLDSPKLTASAESSIFFALSSLSFDPEANSSIILKYADKVLTKYEQNKIDDFSVLLTVLGSTKDPIPGISRVLDSIYKIINSLTGEYETTESFGSSEKRTIKIGNGDYKLSQFASAVTNPALSVENWEKYIVEIYSKFSLRNSEIAFFSHLYPLIQALDKQPSLPATLSAILNIITPKMLTEIKASFLYNYLEVVRVLAKSPHTFEMAKAEKNELLKTLSGDSLITALYYLNGNMINEGEFFGDRSINLFEPQELASIYLNSNNDGLRIYILLILSGYSKPNKDLSLLLRNLVSKVDPNNSQTRDITALMSIPIMDYEPDFEVRRDYFKQSYVNKSSRGYIDDIVGALLVVGEPQLVPNATEYLETLERNTSYNPYLNGLLLIYLVKQPATDKMKAWANRILTSESFTEESIGVIAGLRSFKTVLNSLSATQFSTLIKMFRNHSALDAENRTDLQRLIRKNSRWTKKEKQSLVALVKN